MVSGFFVLFLFLNPTSLLQNQDLKQTKINASKRLLALGSKTAFIPGGEAEGREGAAWLLFPSVWRAGLWFTSGSLSGSLPHPFLEALAAWELKLGQGPSHSPLFGCQASLDAHISVFIYSQTTRTQASMPSTTCEQPGKPDDHGIQY